MKQTENTERISGLPRLAFTMQETADILGVSYITVILTILFPRVSLSKLASNFWEVTRIQEM
ncbi:MAG: hypothetical protein ABSE97_01635 [Verrucomicrobiota bacterium]|jgi:hypothetical protein